MCKEQQEKRFEQERTILVKNYENELQSMIDQQKKQVEKAEEQQHVDLKVIFFHISYFMKNFDKGQKYGPRPFFLIILKGCLIFADSFDNLGNI